ncbi:hypothetical protein [Bailinhaonella thermotolerans]|uniref:Uncharacterized protein n=1 Tax=Bailinhaonella thermotolerans TaxID=1070861 RepID=A0A3A4A078_9ACTN|nr:hypothetical protein [Bailinhaonella thermotolerans]RJL21202.1 hypothetical protein D5H75_37685 [Bailinhaonella thermotolerans]
MRFLRTIVRIAPPLGLVLPAAGLAALFLRHEALSWCLLVTAAIMSCLDQVPVLRRWATPDPSA